MRTDVDRQLETVEVFKEYSEGKGKTVPVQVWRGLEGYRNLRLPDL